MPAEDAANTAEAAATVSELAVTLCWSNGIATETVQTADRQTQGKWHYFMQKACKECRYL